MYINVNLIKFNLYIPLKITTLTLKNNNATSKTSFLNKSNTCIFKKKSQKHVF